MNEQERVLRELGEDPESKLDPVPPWVERLAAGELTHEEREALLAAAEHDQELASLVDVFDRAPDREDLRLAHQARELLRQTAPTRRRAPVLWGMSAIFAMACAAVLWLSPVATITVVDGGDHLVRSAGAGSDELLRVSPGSMVTVQVSPGLAIGDLFVEADVGGVPASVRARTAPNGTVRATVTVPDGAGSGPLALRVSDGLRQTVTTVSVLLEP